MTTALSGRSGLGTLEDFIRVTLAAVCTTCAEWKHAWHQTSVAFDHLRADTHRNVLARPVDTMLAVGRALNAPRPFPEALEALAGFLLPADPPPLALGGAFAVDPAGTILSLPPGRRPLAGGGQLPRDKSWCLVCCERHGWEHVASLAEPDGRGRAALLDLGSVLIAQAVHTCDEFTVTRDVLRRELEALPVRDHKEAWTRPARPMAARRFYQDAAAAFTRATGDIGVRGRARSRRSPIDRPVVGEGHTTHGETTCQARYLGSSRTNQQRKPIPDPLQRVASMQRCPYDSMQFYSAVLEKSDHQ